LDDNRGHSFPNRVGLFAPALQSKVARCIRFLASGRVRILASGVLKGTAFSLQAALEWFVPYALREDVVIFQRARMFVVGHLFGPPLGLLLAIYLHVLDPAPGWYWWAIAGSLIAFFIFPFALHFSGRLAPLSYISVQNLAFVILFGSYHYGGTSSPFLCWLLTVPLVALFYLGSSRLLRSSILACLALYLAIFYGHYLAGYLPPEHVPLSALSGVGVVSVFCAIVFVSMMSLYYAEVVASTQRVRELNAELEARVRVRTSELEQTRREVIARLASAGEFRDNATGQHVIRISHYAYHLARATGIPEPEAAMIRDAAALHDIGKIGIPDSILLKSSTLEPHEWEVMKRHTTVGGKILANSGVPLLDLARTIALTHHEHWDGRGYPGGLQGEAIPLAGRIVAIADVFDATTSDRVYKPAWPLHRAVAFIRGLAGKQFDPRLAEVFVRELPTILQIKSALADLPISRSERAEATAPSTGRIRINR
jgi:hypothetical protein